MFLKLKWAIKLLQLKLLLSMFTIASISPLPYRQNNSLRLHKLSLITGTLLSTTQIIVFWSFGAVKMPYCGNQSLAYPILIICTGSAYSWLQLLAATSFGKHRQLIRSHLRNFIQTIYF